MKVSKMETQTLLCPYVSNCQVYRLFVAENGQNSVLDVINESSEGYSCMALESMRPVLPSGRAHGLGIEGRFISPKKLECSHIKLLNTSI